jgi:hypothetical protein
MFDIKSSITNRIRSNPHSLQLEVNDSELKFKLLKT